MTADTNTIAFYFVRATPVAFVLTVLALAATLASQV